MLLCGSRFKASGLRLPKVSDRKKTSKVGGSGASERQGPFCWPGVCRPETSCAVRLALTTRERCRAALANAFAFSSAVSRSIRSGLSRRAGMLSQ